MLQVEQQQQEVGVMIYRNEMLIVNQMIKFARAKFIATSITLKPGKVITKAGCIRKRLKEMKENITQTWGWFVKLEMHKRLPLITTVTRHSNSSLELTAVTGGPSDC